MSRRTLVVLNKLLPAGGSTTAIRSMTKPISKPPIADVFNDWCEKRGKKYASREERQRALKAFKSNRASLLLDHVSDDQLHKYPHLDFDTSFYRPFYPKIEYPFSNLDLSWHHAFRLLNEKEIKLVVVEFSLSCRAPILRELAKKTPHVLFLKLDVDDHMGDQSVAREYKIEVFPSIVFFKEDNVIERIETTKVEEVAPLITLHDAAARAAHARWLAIHRRTRGGTDVPPN